MPDLPAASRHAGCHAPDVIRAAAGAGSTCVGLRLVPTRPGEAQHPMLDGSPMMRECLALLADTGLKVLNIETVWIRPETDPEALQRELDAAACLGARSLQVACANPDGPRATGCLARLAELAADREGLRVELEYTAFSAVTSLDQALRMIAQTGAGNAGILVDALHVARCGTAIAELAALDPGMVHVYQICDAPLKAPDTVEAMLQEARFGRLLPDEGALPLRGIRAALPPEVHVSVEVPLAAARHLPFGERAAIILAGYRRFCEAAELP